AGDTYPPRLWQCTQPESALRAGRRSANARADHQSGSDSSGILACTERADPCTRCSRGHGAYPICTAGIDTGKVPGRALGGRAIRRVVASETIRLALTVLHGPTWSYMLAFLFLGGWDCAWHSTDAAMNLGFSPFAVRIPRASRYPAFAAHLASAIARSCRRCSLQS